MASMMKDDEEFGVDEFEDDMDMLDSGDFLDNLNASSMENEPSKKRKWRDAEEYREWKRLRDLLGDDDDMEELDF